jgi:hypothetical protein
LARIMGTIGWVVLIVIVLVLFGGLKIVLG